MSKSTSPYPTLSADGTGTGVVSHAGAAVLLRAAEKTGLTSRLSEALAPWRKPLATHDPGKIISDLAVAVAIGGDCLADINQLRADPAVFGQVASDPTVSRLISTLADDAPAALSAIATARAAARAACWSAAGAVSAGQGGQSSYRAARAIARDEIRVCMMLIGSPRVPGPVLRVRRLPVGVGARR